MKTKKYILKGLATCLIAASLLVLILNRRRCRS